MKKTIAVLSGDGIGPEVMRESLKILDSVAAQFGHQFEYSEAKIGGAAYDEYKTHCPDQTLEICKKSDAILFGSVGGPVSEQHLAKWQNCEANSILKLRQYFQFNINVRPIQVYKDLTALSPLKKEIIAAGIDILIFRELNGDIYFGKHELTEKANQRFAIDEATYSEDQIRSIAHAAFHAAKHRKKQVISVDKANVLATSKLWRQVITEISHEYPDIELKHMLVDNCAMQLILNPNQFDVIVTSNMFGDILSDLAASLPGSVGLIPSASINHHGFALYEPSGGSAPDIAGLNIANPVAQILSIAMMLRYSFSLEKEAHVIEQAIQKTLTQGIKTKDISRNTEGAVSTSRFVDAVELNVDKA